eukprot:1183481-Prorocentrum_minimum.AAC.5
MMTITMTKSANAPRRGSPMLESRQLRSTLRFAQSTLVGCPRCPYVIRPPVKRGTVEADNKEGGRTITGSDNKGTQPVHRPLATMKELRLD